MRERQEGIRWDRAIATASAVMLTACGLWVLSRVPSIPVPRARPATETSTTTLVMLPPPAARAALPTRLPERSANRRRRLDHPMPLRGAAPPEAVANAPATPTRVAAATPSTPRLDLRVPAAPVAPVADAPWTRTTPDELARAPVVTARMQDNSLMGKLARSGRAMECAELRAALGKPSASAEVIVDSMRKRGCD